jgi:hypothetical protein
VDDLVEVPPDHPARQVAEDRQRHRVDCLDAQIRVHQVDAERRPVEQGFERIVCHRRL